MDIERAMYEDNKSEEMLNDLNSIISQWNEKEGYNPARAFCVLFYSAIEIAEANEPNPELCVTSLLSYIITYYNIKNKTKSNDTE